MAWITCAMASDYVRGGLDYVRGAFNNEAQGTIYVRGSLDYVRNVL